MLPPPGWEEATDPKSGRKYYANRTTHETRRDLPPAFPASSVPVPAPASVAHPSSTSAHTSDSGTGTDPGLLFTAPNKNAAWNDPAKLIPMTRVMLNKSAAFPTESIHTDLELLSITPGQIADLCHIQRRTKTCGQNIEYTPLNPYRMSTMSAAIGGEDERIDVQIQALKEKLKKFEGDNGS
jgi:hypothetical protein